MMDVNQVKAHIKWAAATLTERIALLAGLQSDSDQVSAHDWQSWPPEALAANDWSALPPQIHALIVEHTPVEPPAEPA